MFIKPTFYNHSIIITGASQGIGSHLALQLSRQGANLTLAARNAEKLARVVKLCNKNGGKAIAVTTDVTKEMECRALVRRAMKEYGQIHMLINNAGIMDKSYFENAQQGFLTGKEVMATNFWGAIYCTYYALPFLRKTKGRIVVTNSGAGIFPTPTRIFYGSSKHALDGFFDTLRLELQNSGVTVTTVYPEWVNTGISAKALAPHGKSVGNKSPYEEKGIKAAECADTIINAAEKRKHQVIISKKQKFGYFMRPIASNLIDHGAGRRFK